MNTDSPPRVQQVMADLDRLKDAPAADVRSFYSRHVFPLELDRVKNDAAARREAPLDLLFVTCGGQADSVVLAIEATPARFVVLLHTTGPTGSHKSAGEAAVRLGLGADRATLRPVGDGKDPVDLYRVVLDVYRERGSPHAVGIDMTGGFKTMSAAGTLVGAVLPRARVFYMDADQRKLGVPETPVHVQQRRIEIQNPLHVLGDLERAPARDLARSGRWAEAASRYELLFERVGAPEDGIWATLCRGYAGVDRMALREAGSHLGEAATRAEKARRQGRIGDDHPAHGARDRIRAQAASAEACAELVEAVGRDADPLAEPAALQKPAAADLLSLLLGQAERRLAGDEPDTAALLAYRVLEGVVQRRLGTPGVDRANPRAGLEALAGRNCTTLARLLATARTLGKGDTVDPDRPIGCAAGYLFLCAIADRSAAGLGYPRFKNVCNTRHQSLFAHGLRVLLPRDVGEIVLEARGRFDAMALADGLDPAHFLELRTCVRPPAPQG